MHRIVSIIDNLYTNCASCWQRASRKKKVLIYVGVYTIAFLAAALIAYSPFWLYGKTLVWPWDGRIQFYPWLAYIGRTLRRVALGMLNGNFTIPMYDISMELGNDVIGYLSSQGQADPLLLLSAFVPLRYSEYLYSFLSVFRVYLAGLSFSFLCFYFKKRAVHTLIGSIVYCFSGYAIFDSGWVPYYVNTMISLPLLTVGIDKILRSEKPYLFILTMFYAALCGFYHLYMMTIMLAIYGVARFFDVYKESRYKQFLLFAGRGISGYLLGIGLAAVIFLPSIAELLNSARAGFMHYNGAYSWAYRRLMLLRLITPPSGHTYAAIFLFALALLFFSKGNRSLKIFTVTCFAFLLISLGGLIMNFFQHTMDRWTFGFALVAAYVVVEMLPRLLNLSRRRRMLCIAILALYTTVCFLSRYVRESRWELRHVSLGVIFLALTMLVLTMSLGGSKEQTRCREKDSGTWLRGCLCLLVVIANVGINGIFTYANEDKNIYVFEFNEIGYEVNRLESAIERELEPYLLNNPVSRGDGTQFSRNVGMVWQIPGMPFMRSTVSKASVEFLEEVEICGKRFNTELDSTEQRAISNTLLSVKYQVEPQGKAAYVPYGYRQIKTTEKGNVIYENQYALPWGYTYDHAISYSELEALNGVQKQQAMLQAIALDEEVPSITRLNSVQFDERKLPYEFACDGCTWENGTLVVSLANGTTRTNGERIIVEPSATVTLYFSMPKGTEGYVRLKGFNINNNQNVLFPFLVKCEGIARTSHAVSDLLPWYYGREDFLFNLGYSERERNSLSITFPEAGTFKLKDIELFALPMDNYPARVEALRAEPLENIKWGTNSLSGTVDLSKDKILCVSVPYSKGWSATVDGKKAKILRGNYMFMALPLKAGHHDIKFSYCTPGLKLGAVLSALSACIVAGMFMRDRRRRKTSDNDFIDNCCAGLLALLEV